jgi:hypothetical protein
MLPCEIGKLLKYQDYIGPLPCTVSVSSLTVSFELVMNELTLSYAKDGDLATSGRLGYIVKRLLAIYPNEGDENKLT